MNKYEAFESAEQKGSLLAKIEKVRLQVLIGKETPASVADEYFSEIAHFSDRLIEKYTKEEVFKVPAWHKLVGSTIPERFVDDAITVAIESEIADFITTSAREYGVDLSQI